MATGIVLALWMSVNSSAVQPTTLSHPFNHVRSDDSRVREAIGEGYTRSATFRALVDATEALSCIVYVTPAVKLSRGMRGALLHRTDGRRDMPVLRVLVKTNLSRDETIAIIAHELQHVAEALGAATEPEGAAVAVVFETPDATARGDGTYETDAAVDVARKVRDELQRSRR
jgi:hypothetical protein